MAHQAAQLTIRQTGRRWRVWLLAALVAAVLTPAAQAQVSSQATNTTSGTIVDLSCGTGSALSRTFVVSSNVAITDVNLGVELSHSFRTELRITLTSPAGTTVAIMTNTGNIAANLNDLFDDSAASAISAHPITGDSASGAPPYSHSFRPTAALSAFNGQNSVGTWTLGICDSSFLFTGTFVRSDLYVAGHQADLSLAMTSSSSTPVYGATVNYTLTAASAATSTASATGITATDLMPSGLTFVSASGTGSYTSATGLWAVGSLAPGGSAALTITATVTAPVGSAVTNLAQITASSLPDPDSTTGNGVSSEDDYASQTITAAANTIACPTGSTSTGSGYAASGTSSYVGQIFWFDWSCGSVATFNAGATITKSWTVGDGLVVTGQITGLTQDMQPYVVGGWSGDTLQLRHSGLNPIGLRNAVAAVDPQFNLALSAALNGTPVTLRYVIGDAEDSGGAYTNEGIVAATSGTGWQTVEQSGSITVDTVGTSTTIYDPASAGGGTAVVETSAANLSLNVSLYAGGSTAIAVGIFTPYDYGDAPLTGTSYGAANHRSITGLRLGPTVTTETTTYNSPTAFADVDDGVSSPPLFRSQSATVSVLVTGPGKLSGWADWNGDGDFADAGEKIAADAADGGSGDNDGAVNGTIAVLVTPPVFAVTTPTIARFRFSSNTGAASSGLAGFGEVEDYQFTVIYPSIAVTKTSSIVNDPYNAATNPKFIPGGTVQYCVLMTNDGSASANAITLSDTLPAAVSYVAGTLRSGSSCAGAATVEDDDATGTDETDPFGAAVSGSSISGSTATLAVGTSIALTYRVTVQ